MRTTLLLSVLALGCNAESTMAIPSSQSTDTETKVSKAEVMDAPEVVWMAGPADPHQLGPGPRARIVRVSAHWCQWCRVFEHDVLPRGEVRAAIARSYVPMAVDADASPLWMDLPGVEGLPALVFFNARGDHVLSRSGYREPAELVVLLDAIAAGLRSGEIEPYPTPAPPHPLGETTPLDGARARAELERLEKALYLRVNSNDGGFATPSRDPHPTTLLELQGWAERTERAEGWIAMTLTHALRGHSPRLDGDPLEDFGYTTAELIALSQGGLEVPGWTEAALHLPSVDPYRGLQDPLDHGLFRYCAGPGWYHPHFERRAADNLAWALLLRARGREDAALEIYEFVRSTFGRGPLLDTSQRSDPFYFRLRADEREGVAPPSVAPLQRLEVQALAARFDPERCEPLIQLPTEIWPRAAWTEQAEPATVDALGELLIALAHCPGEAAQTHAQALAELALARWRSPGLVREPRLLRLAAGICEALPDRCAEALAGVEGLEVDLEFPAPLAALARIADPSKH